jgi:hypothetical protein
LQEFKAPIPPPVVGGITENQTAAKADQNEKTRLNAW